MADHRTIGHRKFFRLAEKIEEKTARELKNLQKKESFNEFDRLRTWKSRN